EDWHKLKLFRQLLGKWPGSEEDWIKRIR
ncbi:MAG: hypothetical protein ACD_20C00088G0005, partial [uncultured bacterium]